jgi:hypothetical protein
MNEHIDTPIPLKETKDLQTVWHFTKECGEYITRLFKHKVCSVSETRSGGIISWRGCLDNDEYFLLIVIDGVIYAACGEHEMMLPYDLHTVVYAESVSNVIAMKDPVEQFTAMLQLKAEVLPKLMVKLNFQEIMNIFMWEYISPKVEIYETITL